MTILHTYFFFYRAPFSPKKTAIGYGHVRDRRVRGKLYTILLVRLPICPMQGYIVVGYRGTFAFGRDMSDVKFRKLTRILVHGKSVLCREVFKVEASNGAYSCHALSIKDTLNESRDPDRGLDGDRYTARYFLKHTMLEQAFDQLCEAGFRMVGSCASGTSAPASLQDLKPGQVSYNTVLVFGGAASLFSLLPIYEPVILLVHNVSK